MVVYYDDVLPLEPLSYVLFALAAFTLAHFEAYGELLSLRRVVVAPNHKLLPVDTAELVSIGSKLGLRILDEGKHDRVLGPSKA